MMMCVICTEEGGWGKAKSWRAEFIKENQGQEGLPVLVVWIHYHSLQAVFVGLWNHEIQVCCVEGCWQCRQQGPQESQVDVGTRTGVWSLHHYSCFPLFVFLWMINWPCIAMYFCGRKRQKHKSQGHCWK